MCDGHGKKEEEEQTARGKEKKRRQTFEERSSSRQWVSLSVLPWFQVTQLTCGAALRLQFRAAAPGPPWSWQRGCMLLESGKQLPRGGHGAFGSPAQRRCSACWPPGFHSGSTRVPLGLRSQQLDARTGPGRDDELGAVGGLSFCAVRPASTVRSGAAALQGHCMLPRSFQSKTPTFQKKRQELAES